MTYEIFCLVKGDFLAAFTRATPGDKFLTDTFGQNWKKNKPKKIRLENFLMTQLNREVRQTFNSLDWH